MWTGSVKIYVHCHRKKQKLWVIYSEIHEEKYCMALNIGSCQSTVQTQKLRTGVEQRDSTNVSK